METLIRSILSAKDAASSDPTIILNLAPAMPPVTADTPIAEARRNYVRLSAAIHPDRVGSVNKSLVTDATAAFQLVVKTFELFADPSWRRALLTAAKASKTAEKPKKERKVAAAKEPKVADTKEPKAAAAKPTPSRSKKPSKKSDSEDDEDTDDSEGEEEATAAVATVSRNEKIPRSRTNDGCKRTTVTCPKCTTPWMPDDPRQYSLFMAYGLRVHCQLCLLLFGCAAAGHRTPCCNAAFDYDTSMYDSHISCTKCKKSMGFMYYAVTQQQIDAIREAAAAEERKKADANEREARAKARSGTSSDTDDALLALIGKCIVDEQCPICGKGVYSKHHAHVSACKANPPPPKKTRQVRKFIEEDQSDDDSDKETKKKRSRSTTTSRATPSAKKSLASKPKKAAPKKRRRRDDWSDSD